MRNPLKERETPYRNLSHQRYEFQLNTFYLAFPGKRLAIVVNMYNQYCVFVTFL